MTIPSLPFTMHFKSGEHCDTDLIVSTSGIRPNDQLAAAAQQRLGEREGVSWSMRITLPVTRKPPTSTTELKLLKESA